MNDGRDRMAHITKLRPEVMIPASASMATTPPATSVTSTAATLTNVAPRRKYFSASPVLVVHYRLPMISLTAPLSSEPPALEMHAQE